MCGQDILYRCVAYACTLGPTKSYIKVDEASIHIYFYTIYIILSIFVLLISHISNFLCCSITVSILCLRILSTCILCWLILEYLVRALAEIGDTKDPASALRPRRWQDSVRACVCVCVRVLISCLRNADVGIFCVTRLGM
jgi:hypothetical protein